MNEYKPNYFNCYVKYKDVGCDAFKYTVTLWVFRVIISSILNCLTERIFLNVAVYTCNLILVLQSLHTNSTWQSYLHLLS